MKRLFILTLFLAILIVFSISDNSRPITVEMATFSLETTLTKFTVCISLSCTLFGFIMGGIGDLIQRKRAHDSERKLKALEAEYQNVKSHLEYQLKKDKLNHPPSEETSSSSSAKDNIIKKENTQSLNEKKDK